jgi:hypothetical protein
MKPIFLATLTGVLLAASFCTQAEPSARTPSPLDPNAPVPAPSHDSALSGYVRFSADAKATPDTTWRRATVTLAGNEGGDGHASAAAPGAPAAPAAAHSHHNPVPAKQ